MKVKSRIRFDGPKGKFYVERLCGFLWVFTWWSTVPKKGRYSSDEEAVRWFDTYNEARTFCIKLATDVVLEHKPNEYSPLL